MDTEALSEDESERPSQESDGGYEEISFDYKDLNPACLLPPTIPNTLGAEDIDKVIAALTNVPDVNVPDGLLGSGEKRSEQRSSASAERPPPDGGREYRREHRER